MESTLQTAKAPMLVGDVSVRIRNDLYCLNDLHRAAGGLPRHQPAFWLRSGRTQRLIKAYEALCISVERNENKALDVFMGGDGWQGTFAAKPLAYDYAMWISPEFNLKVIEAYDALVNPALDFYDRVGNAHGLFTVYEAAKALGQPPKAFVSALIQAGWLFRRRSGTLAAKQPRLDAGFLTYRLGTYRENGEERASAQPMVTAKGLEELHRLFSKPTLQ